MDNSSFMPNFGPAPQAPQNLQTPQTPQAPAPAPAPQATFSAPAQYDTQYNSAPQSSPTQYQPYDFTPNSQLNYNPTAGINSANIMDTNTQMNNIMTEEDQVKKKLSVNRVILALTFLATIAFASLTFYFYSQADTAKTDVQGQISKAVATAENEVTTKLQEEFAEKEKYPYKTLSTPSDYGELTFEYPKTWSIYISADASKGGNYSAILNPDNVTAGSDIYALHVDITTGSVEEKVNSYSDRVKSGDLKSEVYVVNGTNANVFSGKIEGDKYGYIAIIKIRDKVVVLQTDAQIFKQEFYRILDSAKFNA